MFKVIKVEKTSKGSSGYISLFVGDEYQQKLRDLSKSHGVSQSTVLKQMIDYCLAESDAKKESGKE